MWQGEICKPLVEEMAAHVGNQRDKYFRYCVDAFIHVVVAQSFSNYTLEIPTIEPLRCWW